MIAKLVAYLSASAAKVALIVDEAPLWAFAAVFALDAAVSAVALAAAYRGFPTAQPWRVTRAQARAFLVEAWPFLSAACSWSPTCAWTRLPLDACSVSDNLACTRPPSGSFRSWYVIPITLATSLGPYVAWRKAVDELAYTRAVMLVSRAFFYAGVAGALLTMFAGPLAVRLGVRRGVLGSGAVAAGLLADDGPSDFLVSRTISG